jgi:AbrB family looped-hinge helix DNA binding protein
MRNLSYGLFLTNARKRDGIANFAPFGNFPLQLALPGNRRLTNPAPTASLTYKMVYAIVNGMTIKIDKAGRIVLPKPVRVRLRLREGSELELEERADGLTLRPIEQRPSMVRESGIWVHLGKVPRGFDWDVAVEAIREERIKDTSGL